MKDNRLKEAFLALEIPDRKGEIMKAIHQENNAHRVSKRRPALIAAVVLIIALLGIAAGAAAGGLLQVKSGGKYMLENEDGIVVNPTGFHIAEDVNFPFSETALENISQYITTPPEPFRGYETAVQEDMEIFLDMSLHLPASIAEEADLYRLWASGADGEAVSIHLQIGMDEEYDIMDVYLRSSPGVIGTFSEPEKEEYALPDGTHVTIVIADSRKGGLTGHALYKKDGAVYHLQLFGDRKKELLTEIEAVLDTVK